MPIVVEAVPEEKYNAWVADQKAKNSAAVVAAASAAGKTYSLDELKTEGEKVYTKNCVALPSGQRSGPAPHISRTRARQNRHRAGAGVVDIVMNGSKKNPTMAAWKGQLSDMQIAQ